MKKDFLFLLCFLIFYSSCETTNNVKIYSEMPIVNPAQENSETRNPVIISKKQYNYFWDSIDLVLDDGLVEKNVQIKRKLDMKLAMINSVLLLSLAGINIAMGNMWDQNVNLYSGFVLIPFAIVPWANTYKFEDEYHVKKNDTILR